MAAELVDAGIPVWSDVRDVPASVDIIHGHHLPTTAAAVARLPHVPALYVCHDAVAWFDAPPRFPSIGRYVAVDETVRQRLEAEGIAPDAIRVVLNEPDLDRCPPGPPLPDRPRRALAFAKNLGHLGAIRQACEARAIHLDVIGDAVGLVVRDPCARLDDYDLVFATALSALEAMACGRGVVVCDGRGLAGWASAADFSRWRRRNFGLHLLEPALTAGHVGAAIDRYDPGDAAEVSRLVRAAGGVRAQAAQFLALYDELRREPAPETGDAHARAVAAFVQEWTPPAGSHAPAWLRERAGLLHRIEALSGIEPCRLGCIYAFGDAAADRVVLAVSGIAEREPHGRWTDGTRAVLACRLPAAGGVTIQLDVEPFAPPSHPRQRLAIDVNGVHAGRWTLDAEPHRLIVTVPESVVAPDGRLWLELTLPDAIAPAAVAGGADPRRLGVRLVAVRIEAAEPA
ncbi:MAG: hypothetical protein R2712_15040 [Vicinamibacterales bacterium]